jgi:dipeptidyl aminopeptidase/acylaminoacyl peptidase
MSRCHICLSPLLVGCLFAGRCAAEEPKPALPAGAAAQLGSARFENLGLAFAVAFAPDGKALAAGAWDGSVRVWEVATGKELCRCEEHEGWVKAVAFSPDGKILATAGKDRVIRLWDPASGKLLRRLQGHKNEVAFVAWTQTGALLISHGADRTVRVWDPTAGKEVRQLGEVRPTRGPIALAPDGKTIAAATTDSTIVLWDVPTGKELRQMPAPRWCRTVAFSPDGRALLASGFRGPILVWDVVTGKEQPPLGPDEEEVPRLTFSRDGRSLAVVKWDGSIDVLEMATRLKRCHFEGHANGEVCVAFSPDGLFLASGSIDQSVLLWDLTGQAPGGKLRPVDLTAAELEALWTDLADADAARAYRAMGKLRAGSARSVPFLRTQLKPVVAADPQRVARLLRDLDSEVFARRKQASEDLAKLGEGAEPALRAALADKPSLEVRQRLEELIARTEFLSPQRLRTLRSLEVLEHVPGTEARQLLQALAKGVEGTWLTREAQAALQR